MSWVGFGLPRCRFAVLLLILSISRAHGMDLLQAYQQAWKNDATFQASKHAFDAALQSIPQARSGLLPQVSLGGKEGLTHASTTFSGLSPVRRKVRERNWSLRLDQPVFDLSKIYAYGVAKYSVQQAQAKLSEAQSDLIIRVTKAYFDVLVAEEAETAAKKHVSATQQQLDQAQKGFHSGMASVTDVYEAKARLELARSQAISAANDVDDSCAELQKITNEWPAKLQGLRSKVLIPQPLPDDLQAWMRRASKSNPRVEEKRAELAADDEQVKRMRAGYLPTVDLSASYGGNYSSDNLSSPEDYSTRYRSWELDLQVNMPLYSGGATSSRVTQAIDRKSQTESELDAARRQAATDARRAFSGVKNGLARVSALKSSLQSSQSAVKGNEVGYRFGLRINTDVLNSQDQVFKTLHELIKARYDTLLEGLKLKAAVGTLSDADLTAINSLLTRAEE